MPRTLAGPVPAIALNNVNNFNVGGRGPAPSPAANAFEAMYGDSGDRIFHPAGEETFEAVKMLRAANPGQYTPSAGAEYPNSEFGNNMKQIAQLLKANLGVEAAFTDVSGWDTHQNQGGVNGQLSNRLKDFSDSIAAFWRDLGDGAGNVTLVTMSEFGRTARENGTGGTDHGHANAMFVLGADVKGRQSLWQLAGPRQRSAQRRPRPRADHRLPRGARRSRCAHPRREQSGHGLPRSPADSERLPTAGIAIGLFGAERFDRIHTRGPAGG